MAFTLAEVLITLGIVGVVAALTIPALIQKYQEKEFVTRYKRVYSILNQAYKFAENEYGRYSDWGEVSSQNDYEKMTPYMKLIGDCPAGTTPKPCGFSSNFLTNYTYLNDTDLTPGHYNLLQQPVVRLVSGESIIFYNDWHGVSLMVDLNGSKRPNKLGVDFHYFSFATISNETRIIPGAIWESTKSAESQAGRCIKDKTGWHPGSSCGYWILKYNNMDYLRLTGDEIVQKW